MKIKYYKNFTKTERLSYISSKQVNLEILEYIVQTCQNLQIEILSKNKDGFLKLSKEGKLKHFCFQTTETAIVFFDDFDYIERGIIKLSIDEEILHSWICFKYNEEEYVFDPCLDIVCLKKSYLKVFEARVLGRVTAKIVREELLKKVNMEKSIDSEYTDMLDLIKDVALVGYERQSKETYIEGNDDINSPMFRNRAGYIVEIENGCIRKLTAHYYDDSIF